MFFETRAIGVIVLLFLAANFAAAVTSTTTAAAATGTNGTVTATTTVAATSELPTTLRAITRTFPDQPNFFWQQGETRIISWVSVSILPDNLPTPARVSIILSQNQDLVTTIASGIMDTGSFAYQMPTTTPPGLGYYITIYSNASRLVFQDSQFFEIVAAGTLPDPIPVRMHMVGDLSAYPDSSRLRTLLMLELRDEFSQYTPVPASRLCVSDFAAGSILFTLTVYSPRNLSLAPSNQQIVDALTAMVADFKNPVKNTAAAGKVFAIVSAGSSADGGAADAGVTPIQLIALQTSGAIGGAIAAAITLIISGVAMLIILKKHNTYVHRLTDRGAAPPMSARPADWFDKEMFEMGRQAREAEFHTQGTAQMDGWGNSSTKSHMI